MLFKVKTPSRIYISIELYDNLVKKVGFIPCDKIEDKQSYFDITGAEISSVKRNFRVYDMYEVEAIDNIAKAEYSKNTNTAKSKKGAK